MSRRRLANRIQQERVFSSQQESLYSFLNPSLFTKLTTVSSSSPKQTLTPQNQNQNQKQSLESSLHKSLVTLNTDQAWSAFKSLSKTSLPNKPLINSLIQHLTTLNDPHNLKRAYVTLLYAIKHDKTLIKHDTIQLLLKTLSLSNPNAALSLLTHLFNHRLFLPFHLWSGPLIHGSRFSFRGFLRVFDETCRVAVQENVDCMRPDLAGCNAALEGWCREVEEVDGAERVLEAMSVFGVRPDEKSFGFLGYLYAVKGIDRKVVELEELMGEFGVEGEKKARFFEGLVLGYVKAGNLDAAKNWVLRSLGDGLSLGEESYCEVVKGFLRKEKDGIKGLAGLIVEAQELEVGDVEVERSSGYCIVNACVGLGLLDKAHSILDEMNALGGSVGIGVYVPILKAYCKERRTAEATQLVMDINGSGLELDAGTYDALIEASMSSQDFQSAFALFRDMREARVGVLKGSYLTIMTGLMENQRPELMAAFLDEVVEDPRVEVSSHDWNSIIHAFCKAGRLEDARRTFRRMVFLQYYPNSQTYLSMINGYVAAEKYFNVLMLWNEIKRKISPDGDKGIKFDQALVDAFLYALVKGGFFDAVMQIVEKCQEMKVFVDKWKYKQAFMETHKKLKVSKLRRKNFRKMEAVIAFKNWAGLNA